MRDHRSSHEVRIIALKKLVSGVGCFSDVEEINGIKRKLRISK